MTLLLLGSAVSEMPQQVRFTAELAAARLEISPQESDAGPDQRPAGTRTRPVSDECVERPLAQDWCSSTTRIEETRLLYLLDNASQS